MLLKEHRFTCFAGAEIHMFTVEELVGGLAFWPQRFRLKLPANSRSEAKTIYGADCEEVAQAAADVLAGEAGWEERGKVQRMAPAVAEAPLQTLQIQE
jgi:hypothetical protein